MGEMPANLIRFMLLVGLQSPFAGYRYFEITLEKCFRNTTRIIEMEVFDSSGVSFPNPKGDVQTCNAAQVMPSLGYNFCGAIDGVIDKDHTDGQWSFNDGNDRKIVRIDMGQNIAPDTFKIATAQSFRGPQGIRIRATSDTNDVWTVLADSGAIWHDEYKITSGKYDKSFVFSLPLSPIATQPATYPICHYVTYHTGAKGANITQALYNYPLPIKLNEYHVDFSLIDGLGRDVRVRKESGKLIPFEVEEVNLNEKKGLIWALIDTLTPATDDQRLQFCYGGGKDSLERSEVVFDTAYNYRGVWHLDNNEVGVNNTTNIVDATAFRRRGIDNVSTANSGGVLGRAVWLDGTSDHIILEKQSNLVSGLSTISVEFWTKKAQSSIDTVQSVLNASIQGSFPEHATRFAVEMRANTHGLKSAMRESDILSLKGIEANNPEIRDEWIHYAMIVDRATDSHQAYRNGQLMSWDDSSFGFTAGGFPSAPSAVVTLGIDGDTANHHFNGQLDEVRVYSKPISVEWIKSNYLFGKVGSQAVLMGGKRSSPKIIQDIVDGQVNAGDTLRASVSLTGNAPFIFQWRIDGARIAGGDSVLAYAVDTSRVEDIRLSLEIQNEFGSVLSKDADFKVDPPVNPPSPNPTPLDTTSQDSSGQNTGGIDTTKTDTTGQNPGTIDTTSVDTVLTPPPSRFSNSDTILVGKGFASVFPISQNDSIKITSINGSLDVNHGIKTDSGLMIVESKSKDSLRISLGNTATDSLRWYHMNSQGEMTQLTDSLLNLESGSILIYGIDTVRPFIKYHGFHSQGADSTLIRLSFVDNLKGLRVDFEATPFGDTIRDSLFVTGDEHSFMIRHPISQTGIAGFRVTVSDGQKQSSFPNSPDGMIEISRTLSKYSIPVNNLGDRSWKLIGIPVKGSKSATVLSLFQGVTDNQIATAIFNPDKDKYTIGNGNTMIPWGSGLWIASRVSLDSMSFGKIVTPSTPQSGVTDVDLVPGWNLITSPSLQTTYLSIPDDSLFGAFSWNSNTAEYEKGQTLNPWVGYFLYSFRNENTRYSLTPLPSFVPLPKQTPAEVNIRLKLSNGSFSNFIAQRGGNTQIGPGDHPQLPSPERDLSISIIRNGMALSRDEIEWHQDSIAQWNFVVQTIQEQNVHAIPTEIALPDGWRVALGTRSKGIKALELDKSYAIIPSNEINAIFAGPIEKIEKRILSGWSEKTNGAGLTQIGVGKILLQVDERVSVTMEWLTPLGKILTADTRTFPQTGVYTLSIVPTIERPFVNKQTLFVRVRVKNFFDKVLVEKTFPLWSDH